MDKSAFDKGFGGARMGEDFDIANYLLLPLHLLSRQPSQVSGGGGGVGKLVCAD